MSQPPASVDLGPHHWRILTDDDTANSLSNDSQRGRSDPQTLTIRLDCRLADNAVRETLLHELLHACWNTAGLDSHAAQEHAEQIINSLAPMLLDALRRNPDLVAYLVADQR